MASVNHMLLVLPVCAGVFAAAAAGYSIGKKRLAAKAARTEEAQRDSRELARSLFENNPNPMWVYDVETLRFLAVNDAAIAHYGYSREDFLSMTLKDIRPPEDVPVMLDIVSRLKSGLRVTRGRRHRKKDGTLIDVEVTSHSLLFGNRRSRFVLVNDVTENRRTIEALRRSEEKYRDLFENANDAIFIVDASLRYIDANNKAVELMGYSREELTTMGILDVIPPDQVPRSRVEFDKLRNRGTYEKFVGKVRTKDGRWIDVEVSSSAIIADGRIVGSRDIMRDISDRKRMEEEILRAQKLESVGALAGGLAHDFNNLLTAILGNITLAKMDAQAEDSAYERLEEAEKASYRARDLTQQLLTFSRGGAPVKKTVALNDLIKDSATFALRGSRSRCELLVPGGLWPVEADAGQLSQVINNLVINADQAMPGGGAVRVSCENAVLDEGSGAPLPAGKFVRITVADRGIGIPREHFERIFDPYFTTKQKGSGLGLATSYSIIKRHGGHISLESELGSGSVFSLYLPASEKGIAPDAREKDGIAQGAGRILIMDDDDQVRDVAGKILSGAGYEPAFARDGAEAIMLYEQARSVGSPFCAVIMDLTVPGGMGGQEAVRKLRELDPGVKAIVSSGYSNDPIMAEFREHGFCGVVTKPYSVKTLTGIVREVIEGGAPSGTA